MARYGPFIPNRFARARHTASFAKIAVEYLVAICCLLFGALRGGGDTSKI